MVVLHYTHLSNPQLPLSSLTPGEEDGVELKAASILQPTGQLTEVTAVQVQGDSQGLPTPLHLVTHWCVCKIKIKMREMSTRLHYYAFGCMSYLRNENVRTIRVKKSDTCKYRYLVMDFYRVNGESFVFYINNKSKLLLSYKHFMVAAAANAQMNECLNIFKQTDSLFCHVRQ